MRTHVSYGGVLKRITGVVSTPPPGSTFISFGRLVNPKGHYDGAPTVALYQTPNGHVAVL